VRAHARPAADDRDGPSLMISADAGEKSRALVQPTAECGRPDTRAAFLMLSEA
jgi:hypothetical protein